MLIIFHTRNKEILLFTEVKWILDERFSLCRKLSDVESHSQGIPGSDHQSEIYSAGKIFWHETSFSVLSSKSRSGFSVGQNIDFDGELTCTF